MAMFLGMISFLLALAAFAAALVLWHHGRGGAGLVRAAGAVLGFGSVLAVLCTSYFMVVYRVQGDFERAYPIGPEMMMGPGMMRGMMERGGMMGPEMMGRGMMGPEGMRGGTGGAPERPGSPAPEAVEPPGHEEHHPEAQ